MTGQKHFLFPGVVLSEGHIVLVKKCSLRENCKQNDTNNNRYAERYYASEYGTDGHVGYATEDEGIHAYWRGNQTLLS